VELTQDGQGQLILAARSKDMASVPLWRLEADNMTEAPALEADFPAGCIAVTSSGPVALGDRNGHQAEIFDLADERSTQSLRMRAGSGASSATFSSNGRLLAVGCRDGYISIWRCGKDGHFEGASLLDFKAHDGPVSCLAFDAVGQSLVSGGLDKQLRVWDAVCAELKHDFGGQAILPVSIDFSPAGDRLAASFFSPYVRIWSWPSATVECTLRALFINGSIVQFLQDSRSLVSAGTDGVVKIWDLETQRERCSLGGGTSIFESLAISPDENTIAAESRDGTVRIYRAATSAYVK
jgi:WD40 repeat protein